MQYTDEEFKKIFKSVDDISSLIVVAFQGGAYGSFLLHCLESLNNKTLCEPFTDTGSSHKVVANGLRLIDNKFYLNKQTESNYVKYHPVRYSGQSLYSEVIKINKLAYKTILLYPSKQHYLLTINNMFSKPFDDYFSEHLKHNNDAQHKFLKNLYEGWNIDDTTSIKDIPIWIKREFLSYYIFPSFEDQFEWYMLDNKSVDCLTITTEEFLYDFEKSFNRIVNHCGVNFTNREHILKLHKKMLSTQHDLNKDEICDTIVNNIINTTDFQINTELSLVDEAYIQHKLRIEGINLKCFELNIFPKNLNEFKRVIE